MGLLRGAVAVWAASLDGKKAADQNVSTKKTLARFGAALTAASARASMSVICPSGSM